MAFSLEELEVAGGSLSLGALEAHGLQELEVLGTVFVQAITLSIAAGLRHTPGMVGKAGQPTP